MSVNAQYAVCDSSAAALQGLSNNPIKVTATSSATVLRYAESYRWSHIEQQENTLLFGIYIVYSLL